MATLVEVFDPPQCCPTGVCGPGVNPALVRFAADLDWLKGQGVAVKRFNLAQQPAAFTQYEEVKAVLMSENVVGLPLFRVNGEIVFKGKYPSRSMLARWCGVNATTTLPITEPSCCGPSGCC